MADRIALPNRKPFKRTSAGYRKCPHCEKKHIVGGQVKADRRERSCYLRALIPGDMKQSVIDRAQAEGLSISALVRAMVRFYLAGHPEKD